MRAPALTAAAFAALAAGSIPAATGDGPAQRPATVRVVECVRGPEERAASFRAAMRPIAETAQMRVRFRLEERAPGKRFRKVAAPGLGAWRVSRAGVEAFAYRQRVVGLSAGSAYRMVVGYRWHDADGEVLARARRTSRACNQGGRLPDLSIARIEPREALARPGVDGYAVVVRNDGDATARKVPVKLQVDGSEVDEKVLDRIAAGATAVVGFRGPVCEASVTAVADGPESVRESDEGDNSLTSACP